LAPFQFFIEARRKAELAERGIFSAPASLRLSRLFAGLGVRGRGDRYSELRNELRRNEPTARKIEMYYIGG
jgi:hypothetical protein